MTRIIHAAALGKEDAVPFAHGVALARASGGRLVSVHAKQGDEGETEMPDAARVLTAWGDPDTELDAQSMVHDCCDDPVDTLLNALGQLQPDLVIAATHQREGLARVLVGSRAEAIAHNVSVPTLLLPVGAKGFVSDDDGTIDLRRILVPLGDHAEAKAAIEAAVAMGRMAHASEVELVLLHVGPKGAAPDVTLPDIDGWRVSHVDIEDQQLEDAIVAQAEDACLVVMATRGHDSITDVLRGSHTDRVLHRAHCPVLSVPVA